MILWNAYKLIRKADCVVIKAEISFNVWMCLYIKDHNMIDMKVPVA